MTVRISPPYLEGILASVFSDAPYPASSTSIGYAMLCGGVQPSSPTETAGVTVFKYITLLPGQWLPPSDGVSMLSFPMSFTPTASGTITFLRLAYAGSAVNTGVIDIPVGLVGSGASAIVSSTTATPGSPVQVTDVRVKLNTAGSLSVGATIAYSFLNLLLDPSRTPFYQSTQAASKYDALTNGYSRAITLNAYDGPIPDKADDAATGTKLWTKAISGNNLFNVSGLGMGLIDGLTANALASGTPTYVRVTKAAYTGVAYQDGQLSSWPATVFQLPIGPPTNGCIMTPSVLVSGQSATITNMTITLQP